MRRGRTSHIAMVVAVCSMVISGCGESRARRDAREGLVRQLVEGGDVPQDLAECVVERFFDDRSDEELATFFAEPEATAADLEAFAELTRVCVTEAAGG